MMMSSRPKRARSPVEEATIPSEDCTRDTFDQHANLNDRQFLCWVLQTEARVRFAKLEGRDRAFSESTTLSSEYLLDLYPANDDEKVDRGPLVREHYAYGRKSLSYLQDMRDPDSSFESLTRLAIDQPQSSDLAKKTTRDGPEYLPAPPNLLYFEIILEAFMGYRVPSFHSKDPAQPRAAIMGGAVVAVLTSWRDKNIISIFKQKETELLKALLDDHDQDKYQSAKEEVTQALHRYFLHEYAYPSFDAENDAEVETFLNSPFSMGDVDIFLGASPLTQSLLNELKDLPLGIREIICSNLGGSGFVHRDLQAYAISLCGEHLEPQFEGDVELDQREPWEDKEKRFCYALTANGLSFALGSSFRSFDPTTERWPRTTQLIMLNEKADIVGGLMDFDISVASCAYDGIGVYATPRAAFSLKTLIQAVTPFVYEEGRNRSRIRKYHQRGFDAYIVDPYCTHDEQCVKETELIRADQSTDEQHENEIEDLNQLEAQQPDFVAANKRIDLVPVKDARWRSTEFHSREAIDAIKRAQAEEGQWTGELICNRGDSADLYHENFWYSAALVEKSPGHAIEYFAKRDNWSEEQREELSEIPGHRRFACRECRNEYGLSLVVEQAPTIMESLSNVEDVLHGEYSYRHKGFGKTFDPQFYTGGAFNSFFVGKNGRSHRRLVLAMESQQILEEARFLSRHGPNEGCRARFVYGSDLESVFNAAASKNLPPNGRSPVGLNPERFIAKCKGCQQWLHECEFSVEYCERCWDIKPPA